MKISSVLSLISVFLLMAVSLSFGQLAGQIPLNPKSVPQFVDPLPHFAGARLDGTSGGSLTVSMEPTKQIAVSTGTVLAGGTVGVTPGVGLANFWAYKLDDGTNVYGPLWPAFTIDAKRGNPLNVTYVNNLFAQTYDSVGLVVDQTLHWADPDGNGMMGSFAPYTGEPPAVVHLHGGEVPSESDGGPDAWFTPGYGNIGPAWTDVFPGSVNADQYYYYPNTQEAATLWFHDHALGATRLNVYAGMAGFYLLRDDAEDALNLPGWSGDGLVQEFDPVTATYGTPYLPEIEIVIQDRMFDTNGKLYFPNLPPNPNAHPYWTPEFVGDIITVNGKTWPYLSVAPRKYRFRFLNGSNARFYELWLQDLATGTFGPVINQIGTDGGLLDAPVAIDPNIGQKLIMGPGERADVIIDFSATPNAVWTLRNSGNTPYPKGAPPTGSTLGRIMQFIVNGQLQSADNSQLPAVLRTTPLVKLTNFAGGLNVTPAKTRQLTLNEVMGAGGPLEVLVNNTKWDGNGAEPGLGETEIPTEGTSEVWQIINLTADAHPIHLHLVQFQLVSRQKFSLNKYVKAYDALFPGGAFIGGYGPPKPYDFYTTTPNIPALGAIYGGNPDVRPYLQGLAKPANPNEQGWKDTFIMYPGEVTTVVARWAPTDLELSTPESDLTFAFDPSVGPGYVWHCHIIDHEDNEMMRPYKVSPNPSRPLLDQGQIGTDQLTVDLAPQSFVLDQNYPNPFNPSTQISFQMPEAGNVRLAIYNTLGQEVKSLVNGSYDQGAHQVTWDATDNFGNRVSSGIYIYRIESGNHVQQKKMMLLK
jgi:spore coat protein A